MTELDATTLAATDATRDAPSEFQPREPDSSGGILDTLRPLDRLVDVPGQRLAPSVIHSLANESDGVRIVAPDRNRSRQT